MSPVEAMSERLLYMTKADLYSQVYIQSCAS